MADEAPVALVFEYHLDEQVPLTLVPAYRHVERWNVTVLAEEGSSARDPTEIGYAHVLVFNMEPGEDISDFADRTSGTWIDRTAAARSRSISEPDLEVGPRSRHVLLLDRVWLNPDFRGLGLGPIVAAAVIERLGRGCHLAGATRRRSTTLRSHPTIVTGPSKHWASSGPPSASPTSATVYGCSTSSWGTDMPRWQGCSPPAIGPTTTSGLSMNCRASKLRPYMGMTPPKTAARG